MRRISLLLFGCVFIASNAFLDDLTGGLPGLDSLSSVPGAKKLKKLLKKSPVNSVLNAQNSLPIKANKLKKYVPMKSPSKMVSKEVIDKTPLKELGIDTSQMEKVSSGAKKFESKIKKKAKVMDIDLEDEDEKAEDSDDKKDKKKNKDDDDDEDDDE